MKRIRFFPALAAAFWMLGALLPSSAADAWLKLAEPPVAGESNDAEHPGWMNVIGFEIDAAALQQKGGAGQLTVRKSYDRASPLLMAACAAAQVFKEAVLHVAAPAPAGGQKVFWEVLLREASITSCTHEAMADEAAEERITLTFHSFRIMYHDIQGKGEPVVAESDGNLVDADGDGLPDWWEIEHELDPQRNNADLDPDGDGLTNIMEWHAGTNPRDPNSVLRAELEQSPGEEVLMLRWNSRPGSTYQVLRSPNLSEPFSPLATVVAEGAACEYPVPMNLTSEFFRIRLVVP